MKKQIQITEIDNGYIVAYNTIKNINNEQHQVPVAIHVKNGKELVALLESITQ